MSIKINDVYNFKNPIRHFLNIDNVRLAKPVEDIVLKDLAWTEPINFRIRKDENTYRTLKLPNILNFLKAYSCFKDYENFSDTSQMDTHKRLVPNLETGDFAAGVYDEQLENDFQELSIYDNLIKLDIKSYYGRVYTHHLEFGSVNGTEENFLTNLNMGNTNGLIMGNYLSLYFAEKYSTKISKDLESVINQRHIDCRFSYFSDDFYFFCNKTDNEQIIDIFDVVLESYDLERNNKKIETWNYLSYNNHHVIEKYWKKIISESKIRYDEKSDNNKLYFINQLIYRMSQLKDEKMQKSFIINFFKSTYFSELDVEAYTLEEYNYHQLCYIFRFVPETLLYALDKFRYYERFRGSDFERFLKVQYKKVLTKSYNEEQLYYYYAIKLLGFNTLLIENVDKVMECNNQLLISYYLKDGFMNTIDIAKLKLRKEESYWFQNYHLILYSDLLNNIENSIDAYLIPLKADKQRQKDTYLNFYKDNLENGISLLSDMHKISSNIDEYINMKIEERIQVFVEED